MTKKLSTFFTAIWKYIVSDLSEILRKYHFIMKDIL